MRTHRLLIQPQGQCELVRLCSGNNMCGIVPEQEVNDALPTI